MDDSRCWSYSEYLKALQSSYLLCTQFWKTFSYFYSNNLTKPTNQINGPPKSSRPNHWFSGRGDRCWLLGGHSQYHLDSIPPPLWTYCNTGNRAIHYTAAQILGGISEIAASKIWPVGIFVCVLRWAIFIKCKIVLLT